MQRPLVRMLATASASYALALAAHAAPLAVTITDDKGAPLADAVIAVEVKGAKSLAPSGIKAELAQRNRQFDPQLLVVQTGTSITFPNLDTVRHHVYSFSPIKTFEIRLYAGTPSAPVIFDKPGVAVLGCNIHDRMVAHVVVVDTPLFAHTDAKGQATLQVPAGDHQLLLWHAGLGADANLQQQLLKMPDAATSMTFKLPVKPVV